MKTDFTPEEKSALKQFRQSISDILDTYDEYDSHDKNLVRWLRAKDLNVKKAEDMIRKQVKFREETEKLQYLPFPEDLLEKLPFRVVGHDKQGTIVTIIPAGIWDFKKLVLAGRNRDILLYLSQIFERYFRYMKSTCTAENMKTQVVMIADCQKFSIPENLCPPVLSFFIELLQLFDANCPEMMKTAYAVNVPKIFSVGWSLVYPFLAQRTLEKVKIIGGGPEKWRKVLLEDIDYRELPSDYGGSNTAMPYYANCYGEKWPPRAPNYPFEAFATINIPPRETFTKSYELSPGNCLSWNFKTDSYDIGFEVRHNGKRMFPYARADAHVYVQDGCWEVTEEGTYSLVFDNTYSKYRGKTLHYAIQVEGKLEENNEFK